jgi:hypothetical protein
MTGVSGTFHTQQAPRYDTRILCRASQTRTLEGYCGFLAIVGLIAGGLAGHFIF